MVPKKHRDSQAQHKPCEKSPVQKSDHKSSSHISDHSVPVQENISANVTPDNFDLSNSSAFYVNISDSSPQDLAKVYENSTSSSFYTSTPCNFDLSNESAQYVEISDFSPRSIDNASFEQEVNPTRLDFHESKVSTLSSGYSAENNISSSTYSESISKPIFDVNFHSNTTPSTFNLSNRSAHFIDISNDSPQSLNFDKNDDTFQQLSSHTKNIFSSHNQISDSYSNEKLEFKSKMSFDSTDCDLTPSPYLTCNRKSNNYNPNMCNNSNSSGPPFDSQREGGTLNSTPFYSHSNVNFNANLSSDSNNSGQVFTSQRGGDILNDTPSHVDSNDSNVNSKANSSQESLGSTSSNLKRLCQDIFNTNSVPNFKRFRQRKDKQHCTLNNDLNSSRVNYSQGNDCNSINFLQINLHHCVAAAQNFDHIFGKKLKDSIRHDTENIGLIQEPYVRRGKVQGFSNKNFKIITGQGSKQTRACIVVSKRLQYWILTQFSNEDQVAIVVKSNDKYFVIVSLYMPGDSEAAPPSELFRKLVMYCEQKNYGIIVGTDANSHHTIWGSTDINERGEQLLDYLLGKNLHICNTGSTPTFQNSIRDEVLDLTLTNSASLDLISEWHVSDVESFSDHNYISFKMNTSMKVNDKFFRNVRKTEWELYIKKVEEAMQIIKDNGQDLDTQAEYLNKVILTAYHESCKEVRMGDGSDPPWWNHDLSTLKKQVNALRRKRDRDPTDLNKDR